MTVAELAATLRDHGLRPIVDPVLDAVLCDCPACHAQDSDPQQLYRPLWIVPRRNTVRFRCDACHVEREARDV